jgi:hypothetical protein
MSVSATCSMMSRIAAEQQQLRLGARPPAQPFHLLLERALLQGLLEGDLELLHLEGLAQEVRGAQAHGLHDVARLPVTGEHHHGHVRQALLEPAQGLDPVDPGQHDVQRDDVGARHLEVCQRLLRVRHGKDLVALAGDECLHVVAHARIVVDHEHAERLVRDSWLLP